MFFFSIQNSLICESIKTFSEFWLGMVNSENQKNLKKKGKRRIYANSVALQKMAKFCMSEDQEKEIEQIFTE